MKKGIHQNGIESEFIDLKKEQKRIEQAYNILEAINEVDEDIETLIGNEIVYTRAFGNNGNDYPEKIGEKKKRKVILKNRYKK